MSARDLAPGSLEAAAFESLKPRLPTSLRELLKEALNTDPEVRVRLQELLSKGGEPLLRYELKLVTGNEKLRADFAADRENLEHYLGALAAGMIR